VLTWVTRCVLPDGTRCEVPERAVFTFRDGAICRQEGVADPEAMAPLVAAVIEAMSGSGG
jgi:hypothetical protein